MAYIRLALLALGTSAMLLVVIGLASCVAIIDGFSGRKDACEILASGKPATATIVRLVDTGTTINDDPVVELIIHVSPVEGTTYDGRAKAWVSRLSLPAIQPGRVVPVKYDPRDRTRIALDLWKRP